MEVRLTLHAQLSSVIETMAKSVLSQVCQLVDEDTNEIRSELSRLLAANSSLADKVNCMEKKITALRSTHLRLRASHRSVGVQTVSPSDDCVSGTPAIAGIFGKDWCMNLWKDREPGSLERASDAPQSLMESVVTLSEQVTVPETKRKNSVEGATSICQQETLPKEELEEQEQQPVGYLADSSTCNWPLNQNAELAVSVGGVQEPSMQDMPINAREESFITYIIPFEEDDDEFIQENQQTSKMRAAGGFSQCKEQTLPPNVSENDSALDNDFHDCKTLNVETTTVLNDGKVSCPICSRTFLRNTTLKQHFTSHKSNYCFVCKQLFLHKNKLASHTCVPPLCSQRRKSCDLCGKTFANVSALKMHYVIHTGEKPHRCPFCGKGFTQKGNLKCHLRIHTGERPFHCSKCEKTFTQKSRLLLHLTSHRNAIGEQKRKIYCKNVA